MADTGPLWTDELEAARLKLCEYLVGLSGWIEAKAPLDLPTLAERAVEAEQALTILGRIASDHRQRSADLTVSVDFTELREAIVELTGLLFPPGDIPPSQAALSILAAIEELRRTMTDQADATAKALADLKTAVANVQGTEASAKALIAGIPGLTAAAVRKALTDAGADAAAIDAAAEDAASQVNAAMADLNAAVAAAPALPVVAITPTSLTGVAGEAFTASFGATIDGAPVSGQWSATDLPPTLSLSSNGSLSGTPNVEAGDAKITFTSDDGTTTGEADVAYSFTAPEQPPAP
jgi:hypothetical protein